ncbi:GGDEF domain-containing protein [Piscinibacter sakaiensis]|uniref:GGDEF domain-containing protein n=1 Tax=Piscinibacter sakaiensis TaxID=1547922 RepID=UPI003AAF94A5
MTAGIREFIAGFSPLRIGLLALLLVALTGIFDSATGYEISFSIFYLIPVSLAAWYAGARIAVCISLVAAVVWLAADVDAGHEYSRAWIPFWNAVVRFGFFVIVAYLLVQLRSLLETTAALAQTDPLTGLLNAGSVRRRYRQAATLAARQRQPVAIGYIDLDNFKSVNDSFGHRTGDEVLTEIAVTLRARARASDIVGRIGGDEFVIVLQQADASGAQVFFSQLHAALIALAEARAWPVGFSVGVAVCAPPPPDEDAAFAFADSLMYEVKRSGKNAIRIRQMPATADG